jgi:hypothetical protein
MSTETDYLIGRLTDASAVATLKGVAAGYLQMSGDPPPEDLAGLRGALLAALPEAQTTPAPPDGELARRVLLSAADGPGVAAAVEKVAEGKEAEVFGDPLTIAVVTAAVVVLNTHGYVRYQNGKWDVNLTVRPLSAGTLRAIVSGLLHLL